MADNKSKLPDFKEITGIASKLFRDVKNSVSEIIDDYKSKHCHEPKATTDDVTSSSTVKPVEPEKSEVRPEEQNKK
ncbi:hypothetical protein ACFORL_11260 [Legionella dresdenensis]|uniref:Uncharacterized protein n=1 Tax=Legionella dresdenensis TaxID=450200 RepID=A0ABV8CHA4_9GAMM